jgi:hypothetical protein
MGTPIKSAAEGGQPPAPPEEKKGLDNPQLQAHPKADDSPVIDPKAQPPIMQGEAQPPLQQQEVKRVMSPEERAQKKARLAVLLDRGFIQDRLKVPLPDDLHGEWVRNDPIDIQRLRTLGFEVDTQYATSRSLHNDGTGSAVIGDVIFMTTSRENKELIDEIRHEQFLRSNSPRKAREEKQFEDKTAKDTGGQIPTFTDSTQRTMRKEELAAALQEVDTQTKPTVTTR